MGDRIEIKGNYNNVVLNVKSTLTNVQQSIGSMSAVDEDARRELKGLIEQLSQALEQMPTSLKEEAEAVAASAQILVEQAKAPKPNKTMLHLSGEGFKKAAENLAGVAPAAVAPAVLTIATQVVAAVIRMRALG